MLKLFVNALTADDNYSRSNMQNLWQQFQTPLSEKQNIFSEIFIAFLRCAWNLKHFEKKDEYPSLIISKLLMLKNVATYTSKRSCLRTPFANERANGFQTLLKTARHHYFPLFSSIRGKLSCKKSALVWCEALRLFLNVEMPMTTFPAAVCRVYCNNFKRHYLRNKRLFLIFYCIFKMCMKFRAFSKRGWVS